ncbi:MAG TPA: NUMOD3 domain-containing DNA-binding protein, partial [Ktedonobacteraceae bacterium]|nr:NUMOD3 domain-containing DNA-binding protein [Ktedonobacteraceae bacterium]
MHDRMPENLTQSAFNFDALSDQPVDNVVLQVDSTPPQKEKYWWSELEHHRIPKRSGIYAIINQRNQHIYIGSAVNLFRRKKEHFKDLEAGKHNNPHLQNAYNRDGSKAFLFVVVEHVEHVENLISREQHYIDNLSPKYNIAPIAGSTLGIMYSPEVKAKLSAARRGNPQTLEYQARATEAARIANTGRKLSLEHIEKLRGRKHTSESIERMRVAQHGREHSPEENERLRTLNIGRKHRPEARENMGVPKRGRKQSSEHIEKRATALRGKKLSPEHAAKSRVAFLGGKHTDEAKAKMSTARKGKKQSPEHIANRSAALRGRKVVPEHQAKATEAARIANTGKPRSPETKAKISATKRAKH